MMERNKFAASKTDNYYHPTSRQPATVFGTWRHSLALFSHFDSQPLKYASEHI